MDVLLEQFDIIINGVRWQLIITVLAAASLTETVKKIPWVAEAELATKRKRKKATTAQGMVVWAINGLLPEAICVTACLFIPTVLPDGIDPVVAIFIGYLSGTLSSKMHALFLAKLMARFNGKDDETPE